MTGRWQLAAFFHILMAILVVGYCLFWAIMARALGRDRDAAEVERHLRTVARARWPHVVVPYRWRLPLPMVGWLLLLGAAASGTLAGLVGGLEPRGLIFWLKLAAVILLFAVHAALAQRPRPAWALSALPLALLAVVLSVPLLR